MNIHRLLRTGGWGVIGLVADIHGNAWALRAVLEVLDARGVTDVVNLGDVFYGPLDPGGTFDLVRDLGWPTVRGNQDRALLGSEVTAAAAQVAGALGAEGLDWLRVNAKEPFAHGGVLCCHGTLERDDVYLLETFDDRGLTTRSPEELDHAIAGTEQPVVACAHSHVPRLAGTASGRVVVNPGSVGLPAYDADSPVYHRMESGSPHARLALLDLDGGSVHVEHIAVPYDWKTAAQEAEKKGRPDWALWLRTGFAR